MKQPVRLLLIVLFGLVLFLAGVITSAQWGWFQPIVTMQIENQSGQALRSLQVQHEGGTARSTTVLPNLAAGEVVNFRFYLRGEGSYKVSATLGDGTQLSPSEGYVESRYRVTEIIGKSQITGSSTYSLAAPPR